MAGNNWRLCIFIGIIYMAGPLWASAFDPAAIERVRVALNAGEVVDCTGCDLTAARLSQTALGQAQLAGADLRRADLTGADLSGADLSDANLDGANLIGADLTDANLRDANLTGAFIRSTRFCRTVLPDGLTDDTGC